MKAKLYDKIKILMDVPGDFSARIILKDTVGTIVECYENPEGYAIEFAIPNSRLVGGFEYENVVLNPQKFIVLSREREIITVSNQ